MPSASTEKLRYIKDRVVNAIWMLRQGKFKLFFNIIRVKVEQRVKQVKFILLNYSKLPGSAYTNKRKIIPGSYQPTVSRLKPCVPLQINEEVIKAELESILATLADQKKHK